MNNTFRMHFLLRQDTTCAREGFIDLVIQLLAIGYDNKCPISRHLSKHFLRKEEH